ncbi:hypothetical protein [Modestobacter sp. Leaf380]|uniref:flagellin N-terminal helical domain-containing protein n=1 Tax=Modestobacter sp. Leaf380 TaxID=1736356 RepID=UPI0006F45B2C|nr:hypothetical protein [Modestobacter sp. Leaf380]KQS68379.1 hypothetical protein ASG41_05110 [Modestobacter sp. Leaf380]
MTHRSIADSNLRGINANLVAVAKLQQQATSGVALNRPSDSPSGTATAMRTQGDLALNGRYAANASLAKTTLSSADAALDAMHDQLSMVRDRVVQGANTGSLTASGFEALALEVDSLGQGILAMANRQVGGRPVFGGTTSGSQAFTAGAGGVVTFGGRLDVPEVRVSPTEVVQTGVTGTSALGPDGANVFDLVADIASDLRTDPGALSARLAQLDQALTRLSDARTVVGVRAARLDTVVVLNAETELDLSGQLSSVMNIDQAKTYTELAMREYGYQAALSASAKTLQTSLVDYLR